MPKPDPDAFLKPDPDAFFDAFWCPPNSESANCQSLLKTDR